MKDFSLIFTNHSDLIGGISNKKFCIPRYQEVKNYFDESIDYINCQLYDYHQICNDSNKILKTLHGIIDMRFPTTNNLTGLMIQEYDIRLSKMDEYTLSLYNTFRFNVIYYDVHKQSFMIAYCCVNKVINTFQIERLELKHVFGENVILHNNIFTYKNLMRDDVKNYLKING